MNNRLGISIQEESYLAYLAMRALERPVGGDVEAEVDAAVAPDTEVISPES
jgi:hypothetical protein